MVMISKISGTIQDKSRNKMRQSEKCETQHTSEATYDHIMVSTNTHNIWDDLLTDDVTNEIQGKVSFLAYSNTLSSIER